jgi:hypothetical protein
MKLILPSGPEPDVRHRLDTARITETADNLVERIQETLPASSLARLAVELAQVARTSELRALEARTPILGIRLASALAVAASLMALWYLVVHIHTRWEFGTITELFEAMDAGFNLMILLAGALWFFITLEGRLKRKKALGFLEELREFVHVIDVTQLYYTPELYKVEPAGARTESRLDYTYLLFCTQMLAVISNLAPLYTRGAAGDSILRAASEVELLANAVSTKLLSKTQLVRLVSPTA